MDRRGGTFQQPLSTKLWGEVPPVLHRGMMLEGVEVSKQGKGELDFDYMTKREEPYQKPKGVQCNRSQRNIQKSEKSNDKRRKREPKSDMEGLLI